ncbi:hypothetical protein FQA39_LY09334 [Lamprigera yunnana]|nr:hypothetical protein FQA39_LY09334 [Lamprigera yunnana]
MGGICPIPSRLTHPMGNDERDDSMFKMGWMLAVIFISTLLLSVQCIPLDAEESKQPKQIDELPQVIASKEVEKQAPVASENEQPQEVGEPIVPLGDVVNPVEQQGTPDLDTDATFWGWGYRRPYYSWRSYSPWRRWGWGSGYGYGGWGRGYGWGGRGYGNYYWW